MHRDRIDELKTEIQEKTGEYNRLTKSIDQYQRQHRQLLNLRSERSSSQDWSFDERNFVLEISRKFQFIVL